MLGDTGYLPPGDRGRHPDLRSQLTLTLPGLGHASCQPSGGIVIAVPNAQIGRLRLELERPTLRGLRGIARILPFSGIEDPFGP